MGRRVTGTSDGGQANPGDHNGQTTREPASSLSG